MDVVAVGLLYFTLHYYDRILVFLFLLMEMNEWVACINHS